MVWLSLILTLWAIPAPAAPTSLGIDPVVLNGKWTGVLTQDRGGFVPEYHFEMTLRQKDGQFTGSSYVSVRKIFARWSLQADFKDGVLHFRETELGRHSQLEDLYWCLKEGKLYLKQVNNRWVLYGSWSGNSDLGPCVPGKIRLEKEIPQA